MQFRNRINVRLTEPDIMAAIESAELNVPANPPGMKFDGGKPRFDLLEFGCPDALLGVVKVMTWAVETKGYKAHSWQGVADAYARYTAAIRRHQNAKARGEVNDSESGFPHDWHIATNALFLAQLQHNADASERTNTPTRGKI